MPKKVEAFYRVVCGNKIPRGKGYCDRWLGDVDASKAGTSVRYFCRDCKVLHEIEVTQSGVVNRSVADKNANIEYDPSIVVIL